MAKQTPCSIRFFIDLCLTLIGSRLRRVRHFTSGLSGGLRSAGIVLCMTLLLTACGGAGESDAGEVNTPPPVSQEPPSTGGGAGEVDDSPSLQNLALIAQATTSMVSPWETLAAVSNGSQPSHSNDKSQGAYGNWNSPNSYQWVEYQWPSAVMLSRSEIYWFDDNGGVLAPSEAYLEYWTGSAWSRLGELPVLKDTFNELAFGTVSTRRLRVTMRNRMQSTGILEWRALGALPQDYDDNANNTPDVTTPGGSSYTPVTEQQYQHKGINPDTALYVDSDHFRIYYGGDGKSGPNGELGTAGSQQLNRLLQHLEASYRLFVVEKGFRSAGLSVHAHVPGRHKLNVYLMSNIGGGAGGVMLYDNTSGLCYLEVRSDQISRPHVAVHEYGHCLTLSEYRWVNKTATGAWWETKAQWVADTYQNSPYHAEVAQAHGQAPYTTVFDPQVVVGQSVLSIIHSNNLYQNWPFFTYLSNNPDRFPGLGDNAIRTLIRQHQNQETPIHTLARMVAPTSAQEVIASYNARLAYMDIGHGLAHQRLTQVWNNSQFRQLAYNNLELVGSHEYRVRAARRPMYGGSNIIPLQVTDDGEVFISVMNLGNGLADSNFTAIVAIRAADGRVQYQPLRHGTGSFRLLAGEDATLVISNTPDTLYQFNAFQSTSDSADRRGLNYQVQIVGAQPRDR